MKSKKTKLKTENNELFVRASAAEELSEDLMSDITEYHKRLQETKDQLHEAEDQLRKIEEQNEKLEEGLINARELRDELVEDNIQLRNKLNSSVTPSKMPKVPIKDHCLSVCLDLWPIRDWFRLGWSRHKNNYTQFTMGPIRIDWFV